MSEKNDKIDLFVRLLSRYQGQIYSYILSLVGNCSDSDDLLQETCSKLWDLFDRYEPGTDFLRWSLRIAHYRVLEYRKQAKGRRKILYTDEFIQQLSEPVPEKFSKTGEYLEKLKICLEKLSPHESSIITMRYHENQSVREIAARINKSVRNVYFILTRIQHSLLRCIESS